MFDEQFLHIFRNGNAREYIRAKGHYLRNNDDFCLVLRENGHLIPG